MSLPPFNAGGDLPPGIHRGTIAETLERFATGSAQRRVVGLRLERVFALLAACGHLSRAIIFGSFVSDKEVPNDLDLFLIMEDSFDLAAVAGEARLIFDHAAAQSHFGASIFWVRRMSCFPSEEEMVSGWALKRDGTARGLVEVEGDAP